MKHTTYFGLILISFFYCNSILAQPGQMEICMVTVDSNSTHNVVIWEKANQPAQIDYINIYRHNLLGPDSLIGSQNWSDTSEFHDYNADPNLRSYTYRIAGVNSLGIEGPKSLPHKTIHFSVLDNASGNFFLLWDHYIGNPTPGYDCWRDSLGVDNWDWVNTATGIDSSWWDNNVPVNNINTWYVVTTDWSSGCTSTRANHNQSRSNKTQPVVGGVSVEENEIQEFSVYPNPSIDIFNVVFSSKSFDPITIEVIDVLGKSILKEQNIKIIGQYKYQFDVQSKGVYFIKISNSTSVITKRIVHN